MFKLVNIKEVTSSLEALAQASREVLNKNGTNVMEEVRNTSREEGTPLSPVSAFGQPREALFEAVYQAEIRPSQANIQNAESARSEMNQTEREKEEDAIIDRFIRDFVSDMLRGV